MLQAFKNQPGEKGPTLSLEADDPELGNPCPWQECPHTLPEKVDVVKMLAQEKMDDTVK